MKGKEEGALLSTILVLQFWVVMAPGAWADGSAYGTGQISNIQYGLVNPAEGTIEWVSDDGLGGPAWQGEAWVQVSDSLGGADADYNTTPDGLGVVGASAATGLASGSAWVDLVGEVLYGQDSATIPVSGWAYSAPSGMMFDYFTIAPTVPGSTGPIEMFFSFDYEIHLTGQAEPGAGYYSDASVSMLLEYEDEFGDWQLVPDGQLFRSDVISGAGTDSDDVTVGGTLSTAVALGPDVPHALELALVLNIPEPGTLLLLAFGGFLLRARRRRGP